MELSQPTSVLIERLRAVGLRPTRQRLALTRLLFAKGDRHVTAEQLHGEVLASAIPVSLATVYNTLHQFTDAGLLREVVVEPGRSYFDTNIAAEDLTVIGLPVPPLGTEIGRVEVIVRVHPGNR